MKKKISMLQTTYVEKPITKKKEVKEMYLWKLQRGDLDSKVFVESNMTKKSNFKTHKMWQGTWNNIFQNFGKMMT